MKFRDFDTSTKEAALRTARQLKREGKLMQYVEALYSSMTTSADAKWLRVQIAKLRT